jgi:cytochrome c-type biogenesis protein CcmH
MADWLFWGIAAALALGSLGVVLAPLLRGGSAAGRRASFDLQVYRDQLREIESDRARGVLSDGEAAATRAEVSRRLLAAADAEAAERAAAAAPPRLSRRTALVALGLMLAIGAGLYARLGAPGLPDEPLQARVARTAAEHAARPSQAEAEAMVAARRPAQAPSDPEAAALIARLEEVLRGRPDDIEGHRLLARSLASTGRWAEARAAQDRVLALLGDAAAPQDLVDATELQVMAAQGYVSPEAEALLARALTLAPEHPVARYYSGLTLMQGGRPDLAYRIWSALRAEGPPDAPWIAPVEAGLAEAARLAGLPPRAAEGPTQAEVDAAGALAPEERTAMIEGMVAQLSDRLATTGGPPEDWARLVRSLTVLGRRDEAAAVLAEARAEHADDPAGLALIDGTARDVGLAP